ncbi:DUF3592 domain-containing protein [Thermomonospora echinospora]|nr:DUF3592 domain-containing protein [Thermomonospora echinospora]
MTGRSRRAVPIPGGLTTFTVALGVLLGVAASFEIQAVWGGAEASGAVVKTWADAKGTGYADVVFTTSQGRRVRASVKEDGWAEMPKAGERVRVWYQPARPVDSAVDARRPGLGVGWQEHAVIWLITVGVFGTMAYRYRTKDAGARDVVLRRSPKDAPPLDL